MIRLEDILFSNNKLDLFSIQTIGGMAENIQENGKSDAIYIAMHAGFLR